MKKDLTRQNSRLVTGGVRFLWLVEKIQSSMGTSILSRQNNKLIESIGKCYDSHISMKKK